MAAHGPHSIRRTTRRPQPPGARQRRTRRCERRAATRAEGYNAPPAVPLLSEPGESQHIWPASRSSGFRSSLLAQPSHPASGTVASEGLSLPVTAAGPQRILTVFPGPTRGHSPTGAGIAHRPTPRQAPRRRRRRTAHADGRVCKRVKAGRERTGREAVTPSPIRPRQALTACPHVRRINAKRPEGGRETVWGGRGREWQHYDTGLCMRRSCSW